MTPFPIPDAATGPLLCVLLVAATLVSEDLTCLTAGLFVAAGRLDWAPAVTACFIGIALGDAGVWLIGRAAGHRLWVRGRLEKLHIDPSSNWFARHCGKAAFVSRFLPGTRVPILLAGGAVGAGGTRVLLGAVVAALVWVPLLVLSVAFFGAAVSGWAAPIVAGAALATIYLVPGLLTSTARARFQARVSRLWRWEFWPAWVFYLPLVPWYLVLSLRYRGFTVWTAANPGIPAGGIVGESKAEILTKLPAQWVVPTLFAPPGEHSDRLQLVREALRARGWDFPLVLKPDAGQRGAGVKKIHDMTDVEKYLRSNPGAVLVQPFHAGPFEAGVFYYRLPGEARGAIFSVTDKVFPVVTGNGHSTLEQLVWAHPRYRMQATTFLTRHDTDKDRVLGLGEEFPLALAGNHCQGTLFRDGAHLVTPELVAVFDKITKSFDGFFIGRFDVRYSDPAEFRSGRGFAVVELNGATSESTNLYDPSWPLWWAYCVLFRQWELLFRIGAANRSRGHQPVGPRELLNLLRTHYRERRISSLADGPVEAQ
ncbi:atp-grasp domain protein : SNARE-like domain protein OS=Leptospira vanthielii serovar Holland str. Waz Holland = ATCC 700522 GN=LEP1GSC199_2322 PE=4 SV=1 [Gemmata massiliana]|uniref:Atp-grasp domain protein: SNARE-like domain protein n=1 Tax=Gemmata massiliana TaxID=1210884 RepID=A0A6P2CXT4_9BACT|nr:VTT domain-containing protein [Gemmata massiliana]VTR92915.1 atp-grasp domain protein : SNARE-like domain protein OS=Leptospira vanthielii serovar Holland str. Waz Holland = ATCC 700522 GN=LEP1GSC199_2322 PE=4 SV=1 [Gemmata massiliana]